MNQFLFPSRAQIKRPRIKILLTIILNLLACELFLVAAWKLPTMYVCLCNAISDKTMTAAITTDTRHVADVFRACGHKPQCGKCLSTVADIISDCKAQPGPVKLAAE